MNNIQTFFNIYVRVMGTMNSPVNFVSTKWCDVHWEISGFLFPRIGDTLKFVRKSLLLPIRTVTSKVFLLHTKMYTYSCQLNLQPFTFDPTLKVREMFAAYLTTSDPFMARFNKETLETEHRKLQISQKLCCHLVSCDIDCPKKNAKNKSVHRT